ncbi:fatty acid desaturase [Nocardia puris]|uniref:Fatty acid desaturase n=1 Tax=Nocardia puris TaxID=208602 RepID=A0A366E369_9NOCA|nr:fatty acid desaturase [Nocardia puris]MBF6214401.1 fatty acid desaturase [Nocardia puris]MBF6369016.1 fatty acid desaturase [Nocardia puris]MBF6462836.1 fatty acid desaturase [Nocardia puris]RBO96783.1 fatty acid desaturase [Nocardia puris]
MSTVAERDRAAHVFATGAAAALVHDLMKPHLPRYYLDLTIAAVVGWAAFAAFAAGVPNGWWLVVWYVVAVLALYRAAVFIHEIAHFGHRNAFRPFTRVWNLVVGIPLLIPSFMYERHCEHHSRRSYGTEHDAEYVRFATMPRGHIAAVLAGSALAPLFGPWRFGVLAPVSWLIPRTRPFIYAQMSTLKIDLDYRGEPPQPGEQRRSWLVQEATACALVLVVAVAVLTGHLSWRVPVTWAAVLAGIAVLNSVRLLGAHRYLGDHDRMSVTEQMMDTFTYARHPLLGELWGPLGLRLHALHHLLPGLPYHALPEAHRRMVAAPALNAAYRLTESNGLIPSIAELWRRAGHARADDSLRRDPR